jgi:dephospho-CoA kinase
MSSHENVKIVAPVALTGGGKSAAVEYISNKGIPKIYVGGFIVEGVKQLGLEVTPENEKKYREEMRDKHGKTYFMQLCIDEMHRLIEAGQRKIVLDGLYSWSEYKQLKHEFPGELIVIAVVTSKQLRKQRLAKRQVRPLQPHEVDARDWAEIENIEKGGPIAIADYFVNNDKDLDWLHEQLDEVLRHAEFID